MIRFNKAAIMVLFIMGVSHMMNASNPKETIKQVTETVDITNDVDYVITGTDPFAVSGSVNIVNTEHATVIFKAIKPSKVISSYLNSVYINGEPAKNEVNCQVKMYGNGAIIMPYAKDFKPLTVYSEQNFGGVAVNDFGLENSGGFMNTLSQGKLNNQIRSFKLKRGYMVTFALGTSGWGYSRCFIADTEDLEIAELPANMDRRISSYRLFRWNDAKKSGIASDTRPEATQAVNASWCYDWGVGVNRYPDTECVPNHIYEDWPSAAECGKVTYSCHMKANNEPGNSADDHPQDVSTVLANWQNLMRTGMRLCSESSHDGSMNHLAQFCDSIDAYGWRCDIVDLHCYWDTGTFNSLTWYSDNYGNGRPIWISEWVWGASWNNNGIFRNAPDGKDSFSSANQQANYNGTVPILSVLNSNPRVERYAFWNSEANASKIYLDGQLSKLGSYYATMEPGIGYRKDQEFIPKVVYKPAQSLKGTFSKSDRQFKLSWYDDNGDMLDSLVVERKGPGDKEFRQIARIALKDKNSKNGASYTYTDEIKEAGGYYYRIGSYPINGKTAKYSKEILFSMGSATGNEIIQYGNILVGDTKEIVTDFSNAFDEAPIVLTGIPTNKNTETTPCSLIGSISKSSFKYTMFPWQKSGSKNISNPETIPYMAAKAGNYKFGNIDIEASTSKVKGDTTEIIFSKPFPEGVKPIVITELKPTINTNPIMVRIKDVTNTGFKAIAVFEEGVKSKVNVGQNLMYLAVTPGQGQIDDDIMISAGIGSSPVYSTAGRQEVFTDGEDTLYFDTPYLFGAAQTCIVKTGIVLRKIMDRTKVIDGKEYIYGATIKRCIDGTSSEKGTTKDSGDELGWIVISKDNYSTGIEHVKTPSKTHTVPEGIYNIIGQRMSRVHKGFNIINGKKVYH